VPVRPSSIRSEPDKRRARVRLRRQTTLPIVYARRTRRSINMTAPSLRTTQRSSAIRLPKNTMSQNCKRWVGLADSTHPTITARRCGCLVGCRRWGGLRASGGRR
jgi:hypothetical protein